MELTSVSKMKRAVSSAISARLYAAESINVLATLSREETQKHKLLKHGKNDKNLIVVISSNKGLCGSYNTYVAREVDRFINRVESKHGSTCEFIAIGKHSETIIRRLNKSLIASFVDFSESITLADIGGVSEIIHERFGSGEYFNVVVIFTNFITTLSNEVIARQILPVHAKNLENLLADIAYDEMMDIEYSDDTFTVLEPNKVEVLDKVLHDLTNVQLYHTIIESLASEHSSRMVAMKNASENAQRLKDELQLSFNRARQAGITREISEIASGADALKEN
jgi:F-type H+-transporting ATPase subunit gamma